MLTETQQLSTAYAKRQALIMKEKLDKAQFLADKNLSDDDKEFWNNLDVPTKIEIYDKYKSAIRDKVEQDVAFIGDEVVTKTPIDLYSPDEFEAFTDIASETKHQKFIEDNPELVKEYELAKKRQLISLYKIDHPEFDKLSDKKIYKKARLEQYDKMASIGLVPPRIKYKGFFDEATKSFGKFWINALGAMETHIGLGFKGLSLLGRAIGSQNMEDRANEISEGANYIAEKLFKLSNSAPYQPAMEGWKPFVIDSTVSSMGYFMIAAATGGSLPAIMASYGLIEGTQNYRQVLAQGGTETEALIDLVTTSVIGGAIEGIQWSGLVRFGKTAKTAFTRQLLTQTRSRVFNKFAQAGRLTVPFFINTIGEGLEESMQEAVSIYTPAFLGLPTPSDEEIKMRLVSAFAGGAIASVPFNIASGISGAVRSSGRDFTKMASQMEKTAIREDLQAIDNFTKIYNSESKATIQQSRMAHILAEQRGMDDKAYRKLAVKVTGKTSTKEMTQGEAQKFLDRLKRPLLIRAIGLKTKEINNLQKAAITDELFDGTLAYFNDYVGPMPVDTQLRKDYYMEMKSHIREGIKYSKKVAKRVDVGKEANSVSLYSSARYIMGRLEVLGHKPFARKFNKMVRAKRISELKSQAIVEEIYKKLGYTHYNFIMNYKDNHLLGNYLISETKEEKDSFFNQMNNRLQKYALAVEKYFATGGEGANRVRLLRWYEWKDGTDVPPDIRKLPKEERARIKKEGLEAEKEGRLEEWIATQTWGTREFYYTAAKGDLIDFGEAISILKNKIERTVSPVKGRKKISETHARKKKGKPIRGAVEINLMRHIARTETMLAIRDDLKEFTNWANSLNLTIRDSNIVQQYVNMISGKPVEGAISGTAAAITSTMTRLFWRLHLTNPVRATWFATRNLFQNLAYGWSAITPLQASRAVKALATEDNSNLHRIFNEEWGEELNQKVGMAREWMLKDAATLKGKNAHRISYTADRLSGIPIFSDSINRASIWYVLAKSTETNLRDLRSGKINWNTFSVRMKLDTLATNQRTELIGLINQNLDEQFLKNICKYKVENLHFKYETILRSPLEATRLERSLLGLMVYPRGVTEIFIHQSIKPFVDGLMTKNWRMAGQGLENIIAMLISGWAAGKLLHKLTGRYAYGLLPAMFDYSPIGPGLGTTSDIWDNFHYAVYNYRKQGDINKFFNSLVSTGLNPLEIFFMAEGILNFKESLHDQKGVTLAKFLGRNFKIWFKSEYGYPFSYEDRTLWEKISHVIFGGYEESEEYNEE